MVRKIHEGWVISTAHDWRQHSAMSAKNTRADPGDYECIRCGIVSKTLHPDKCCTEHYESAGY